MKGFDAIENVKEEREWRMWVDRVFVHVISPNVYRTYDEALETFHWSVIWSRRLTNPLFYF